MPTLTVTELVRLVRPTPGRPTLIGIDGGGASGKSTLGRRIAAETGAPLVKVDDFLTWEGPDAPWVARFEREALRPLAAGHAATYPIRDWKDDELGDSVLHEKTTPAAPLIVVEGVGATRRAWAELYALRIWVEAPREVRLRRALDRDGERLRERWVRWMDQEVEFFAADGTRGRADVKVSGTPDQVAPDAVLVSGEVISAPWP